MENVLTFSIVDETSTKAADAAARWEEALREWFGLAPGETMDFADETLERLKSNALIKTLVRDRAARLAN